VCGIAGIVQPQQAVALRAVAERMVAAMPRRGPDGHGCWAADGIALGHARLSIIDVTDASAQPMRDDGADVTLVFNGEIYNYIELQRELTARGRRFRSHGDSEVLLQAYLEWGTAAFTRCIGMWAVALYDGRSRKLVLSRDRFGIKPLFVHRPTGGGLAFGSTPSVVLASGLPARRFNAAVVERFLVHKSVDESAQSFFDGIEHFPPGCTASLALDDPVAVLRFDRYWDALDQIDKPPAASSFDSSVEMFRERLFDSLRLHTRSDVEVSSCLSGGLDSSTLVSALSGLPEGRSISKVFSAVFPGRAYDEDRYSRAVADRYGLDRITVEPETQSFLEEIQQVVAAQEEPFGSTGIYVQWKVFQAVHARGIKVAIDGQGADEYLGGYFSFLAPLAVDHLAAGNLIGAWRSWQSYQAGNRFKHHVWQNLPALMSRLFGRHIGGLAQSPFVEFAGAALRDVQLAPSLMPGVPVPAGRGLKRTLVRYLTRHSLPALLRYEDRNSMYFSVESRVPFLDHRLVEFVLSLPTDYLMDGRHTKRILREGVRDIVPDLVHRRVDKIGFGNPESEWVHSLISSRSLDDLMGDYGARELIDVDRLRQALRGTSGAVMDQNFLWRVFSLLAWRRWAFR
jgi:asparagine synthase (glutamine-hydrolysing)